MTSQYELLYQCFITEQMSLAQMQEHMAADDVFRRWMDKKIKEKARDASCR